MARQHLRLDGHESEQAPRDSEGQGSLVCCNPWDHKELGMTVIEKQHKVNLENTLNGHVLFDSIMTYRELANIQNQNKFQFPRN